MNQILMIENKKKVKNKKERRNSGPIEIKNIIRFFAIALIIFGLVIIGHSTYAIYVDAKGNSTENLAQINISRENDTLIVDVQSEIIIDKFKYNWNNSEQKSIPEESKSFQEEIVLPNDNSVLTIVLEDETGRAVTYTKEIILDGVDIAKPTIEVEQKSTGVLIKAIDDIKIDYLIYRIDEGEEIRVDKNNEDDKTIEYVVNGIERGEHILYISAYDANGNVEEVEQEVKVSSDRPTIKNMSIDQENAKIIIEASDVDGLRSIEVNLNGAVYTMNDVNRTEATFSLDIQEGKNTISIKLTNVNGLTAEGATEFDYAR